MDRIRFPHSDHIAKVEADPGPAWGFDKDGSVMLRCGQCRKQAGRLINHSIDADGTVNGIDPMRELCLGC